MTTCGDQSRTPHSYSDAKTRVREMGSCNVYHDIHALQTLERQICTGYKNVGQIMILVFNLSPTTTTTTIKTPTTTAITTFASSSTEAHPSIMLGFLFVYQPVKNQSQVDQILVIEPRS
ncbi:hypothetical protein DFH28DRAFT_1102887 [Melampsora americana]|nr:hypothetical protein DFH28DRAFT_1102887 [Melampsora americana]